MDNGRREHLIHFARHNRRTGLAQLRTLEELRADELCFRHIFMGKSSRTVKGVLVNVAGSS